MRLILLLLLAANTFAQSSIQPIGGWREHLPYGSTIDVTASPNKIYAATPYSLFSVDLASKEIERISRISGLSETGISTIKFNAAANQLFVAYTNSNIDVITNSGIKNIPELKRETIAGDKNIYHIYPAANICYLSTGIGVVVLNTSKYEISDTWLIGKNGGYVKTYMLLKDAQYYYAATEEGLKRASVTTPNLADFTAWQNISGSNGLMATSCKGIVTLQGKIVALQNDSLFVQAGNTWAPFFANGIEITSINVTENKLTVCQRSAAGNSRVLVLDENGTVLQSISQPGIIGLPRNAIMQQNNVWIADEFHALSHWNNGLIAHYELASPEGLATGEMVVYKDFLYAAAGAVNEAWNYQYNANGFYKFGNGSWTNYNRFTTPGLDSLLDFVTVAIDPRDESIWAGSFGGGLVHISNNNSVSIIKHASPLGAAVGDPGNYRISGLAFDGSNNLWIANYAAPQYLHVLKNDGKWQSFTAPFTLFENSVSQILVDDYDQKWIVSPKGNGLLVFNHGITIENTSDDRWGLYRSGAGAGNLPSNEILSIAKDKSGAIWVGTKDGIGVIQCPHEATTTGCEAILPVAQNGNFAGYLFKGEEVRSIAVDGADRKWIGTKNGVWLISADGEKVLERFTEDNSFLLSNDVTRITINGTTGEVFFSTAKGICSFRGSATEATETTENLLIYPNPVPPGYSGTIGIKGLAQNSFIKITELNGRLVYQAKALGGQSVWNGKDYKGRQISSGIYLVLVAEEGKAEKIAGKIVFVAR